ncbi:hypothetical protein NRA32_05635 [Acinetobacter baumannii]|nr:hypothetical protein [Acinetobacter baumannii]
MTDLNKLRSEFEAWVLQESPQMEWELNLKTDGEYDSAALSWGWAAWQEKANAQAVPETQQKLTNTYYWEGSDYVVDCPFEYEMELDKGEIVELQKWQRTESTKLYFANIYKDEENFEILQFASKAEAENAVAENLKMLEASESGAEG